MSIKRTLFTLVIGAVLAVPASRADSGGGSVLGDLTKGLRAEVTDQLNQCAAQQGIKLEGEASILTSSESSMAFLPVQGIGFVTRAQLADWTTVGFFTVSIAENIPDAPANEETAPAGDFRVEVRAPEGTTLGEYRVVDPDGNVVQAGELTVTEDPTGEMPSGASAVGEKLADKFHFPHIFRCPWYYPYGGPYYFRYYPVWKHGCYWWHYQWWWGHLSFRYCLWPHRFCHRCCW